MKRIVWRALAVATLLALGSGCQAAPPTPAPEAPPPMAGLAQPAALPVTLFADDFEGSAEAWNLEANFAVVPETGANHVLEGAGHAWASLTTGSNWSDYTFTTRVKMLNGAVQLMFRMSDYRGRYILGLHPGGMYLRREAPWENFSADLASNGTGFAYGTWYSLSVQTDLRRIRVSVDGLQRIDYTDPSPSILWAGTIGLETVGSGPPRALFDDVLVSGVPSPEAAWVKTGGPIGGLGYDVRYGLETGSVQEMYVTDNYSGVNKSLNGGQTWFTANRGIIGRTGSSGDAIPVFSLTVDPNNANIVWAGLKDVKGVYKSVNGGQTWSNVTPPIAEPEFVFRGFTIQSGNSNVVYAAGEIPTHVTGLTFDRVKGRVYRTDNGGATWTQIWQGDNLARYVIIHPSDPNVVYVSTGIFDREAHNSLCNNPPPLTAADRGGVGVLRGVRAGSTWTYTVMNGSPGSSLTDLYVGSLVMHPTDPDILLAGTGNNACSQAAGNTFTGGVFRTEDGGINWSHALTNDIITSVEFSPSDPDIAYASARNHFYASDDGGQSWDPVAGGPYGWGPPGIVAGFPIDILVDPDEPLVLFANNYGGGNVKSADGGVNWSLASQGYTGALMFDLSVDPTDPDVVYASARSGGFRSLDGGANWQGLAYPPAGLVETYSIALIPGSPQVLLAAQEQVGGLFRSTNGGLAWTHVFTVPGTIPGQSDASQGIKRIAHAPSDPMVIYAGTCRDNSRMKTQHDSKGVFKSVDGGLTWNAANDPNMENKCVNDLAVDPDHPEIAFAATLAGLYQTIDGGGSWMPLTGLPVDDVRSVAIRPDQPSVLYAGTQGSGAWMSPDGGTNWIPLPAGMEANDDIWALEIDPVQPDVVWAGSNRTGVYRWDSDESLWVHVNAGLRTRAVTDLAVSGDGSVLYAATWGEGVFRLQVGVEVGAAEWRLHLPLVVR